MLLYALLPVCLRAYAQEQRNFHIEQFGSSTYLLFAEQHLPVAQPSGKLNIVCALPRHPSKISFVFADGDVHDYTTETIKRNTSVAVLLRGDEQLRFRRPGLAGMLRIRSKRIHGDTVLLRKLQTKNLETVRYKHEDFKYYDGEPKQRFSSNIIMHLTKEETTDLRRKATGVRP